MILRVPVTVTLSVLDLVLDVLPRVSVEVIALSIVRFKSTLRVRPLTRVSLFQFSFTVVFVSLHASVCPVLAQTLVSVPLRVMTLSMFRVAAPNVRLNVFVSLPEKVMLTVA